MNFDDLWEKYNNPKNKGELKDANIIIKGFSTSCGDKITLYIKTENNIVKDAKFDGEGCAISTVASSEFCDYMKGKSLNDGILSENDMLKLLGLDAISSSRLGCLMLPVNALKTYMKKLNK